MDDEGPVGGHEEFDDDCGRFGGIHNRVISRRISVKENDGMTSRSDDGGIGRGAYRGGQMGASEDDEDDVKNERRDFVHDQPYSTHPSIMLDHTPTSITRGRLGPIMNFHRMQSNIDSATNIGGIDE